MLVGLAIFLLYFLLFPSTQVVVADTDDIYAVKAGKIITVTSNVIENGIIIIKDGIIQAVGQNIEIPIDAEVIEADSMWVYPGFIDSFTSLAIKKPKASQPSTGQGQRTTASPSSQSILNPEKFAFDMLDPKDSKIEKIRNTGVTTVLTVPNQGIFRGHSAIINLTGNTPGEMVLKSQVASHLTYNRNRGGYPSTTMAVIAFQRQTFYDAIHHNNLWARYNKQNQGFRRPEMNKSLDALISVLNKKVPIIISANTENEIKRAIKFSKEFNLNYLISGVIEGWRVVDKLKSEMKPVLVSLNYPKPESVTGYSYKLKIEGPKKENEEKKKDEKKSKDKEKKIEPELAEIHANAGKLLKVGIKIAFTSEGIKKPEDYIKNVSKAIKQGLPKEEALKALTINPAQIFGIAKQVGSIEEGKIANLVISSGDIFEEKTKIKYVFVDGKKFEMKEKKKSKSDEEAKVDVTGSWEAVVDSPEGEVSITLEFNQSGNDLTGQLISEMGEADIYDGSVNGNKIIFSVEVPIGGQPVELVFEGVVEEDDSIEGTIDLGPMGSASWTATKPGF